MKKNVIIAGLVIILFSFLLRIYSPLSDLPPDISISGSIYTDEGNQCHNSRNKVLFGEWFPDNWKITNYNPVVPWLKLVIFKIFGVGLLQVRSVSYLFAFLSLLFFFLTLKSYFSPKFAISGIFLLGFNYLYIMYNRIGTFETPMIFWMILSIYFLERYRTSGKYLFTFLSGITAFTAFVFKMTGAHFIPVPVTAILIVLFFYPKDCRLTKRSLWRGVLFFLGGVVIIFAIWLIFFYIPNREWIKSAPGSYIGNQMFPKSLGQMFGNILAYNWKEQFFKMAPVWVAALFYIPFYFRRVVEKIANITETAFVLFLLSHTAALMIMNHRPTRYLIASIPPMVFMAVHLFKNFSDKRSKEYNHLSPIMRIVYVAFDLIWLNFTLYYCIFPLYSKITGNNSIYHLSLGNLVLTLPVIIFLHYVGAIIQKIREKFYPERRNLLTIFLIIFLIISFAVNMNFYFRWARDRTHYVEDISRDIGNKIHNGYIAGLTAPVAVLGSRNRSLFLYPKFVHWGKDTLDKYSITHALLATFNFEISNFFQMWPGKMENARLLKVYNVKEQFLHLYSLIFPYIDSLSLKPGGGGITVSVVNGDRRERKIGFKLVNIPVNREKFKRRVELINIPTNYLVDTGRNKLNISDTVLKNYSGKNGALLWIKEDLWPKTFRYEGEKFPRKSGTDIRDTKLSGSHSRVFIRTKHRPGFIISSNAGKFIPFSEGILIVDYKIKFDNLKSRIRPLAVIDIFNNSDKRKSVETILKKRDIKKGKFNDFVLITKVKGVKNLEFRVFATGYSDLSVDYIDVTYYQGKFLPEISNRD